ncbi:MraY family glycosyltransferase [Paenarthrobacter sp. 2TAF44]|uniref:MraY family glycosyltransferase n=1 Tax=Paenarthrobacter sp. 2TAF44 TaxID=3233018 RepID=UPI003F9B451B
MSFEFAAAGLGLLASLLAPYVVLPLLRRLGVVDIPSARSSHSSPAIRGAGLATLVGFITGCLVILAGGHAPKLVICVLLASAAAAGAGWLEDFKGISIKYRVASQLLIGLSAAAAVVAVSGAEPWIIPLGGLFITGFINVANFMDGVDGISGLNGAVFGGTYAVTGMLTSQPWLTAAGLVLAAVYAAFLPWNLGRNRIFLGDSGSYLLGAAVSVMAFAAFCSGAPLLAILGPIAIYLADATYTLLSRIAGGQRWYESHRSHTYHQLEDLGLTHLQVAAIVAAGSCATGALGILAAQAAPWTAVLYLGIAGVLIAGYLMTPAAIRRWASNRHADVGRSRLDG